MMTANLASALIFGLVGLIVSAIFIVSTFYFVYRYYVGQTKFWQSFAKSKGWRYQIASNPATEKALVFQRGAWLTHLVSGEQDGRAVRIFSTGIKRGKNSSYHHTVFGFKFAGFFPHLYLNHLHNQYGTKAGVHIPLPAEFEKDFRLYTPTKYEIEALEIFTPDLLEHLLNIDLQYDLELVDQELLVFVDGLILELGELERTYAKARQLFELLAPRLDRFSFSTIGSASATLS